MVLLSTRNICFGWERRKLTFWYAFLTKGLVKVMVKQLIRTYFTMWNYAFYFLIYHVIWSNLHKKSTVFITDIPELLFKIISLFISAKCYIRSREYQHPNIYPIRCHPLSYNDRIFTAVHLDRRTGITWKSGQDLTVGSLCSSVTTLHGLQYSGLRCWRYPGCSWGESWPRGCKTFSCSTQLSMKRVCAFRGYFGPLESQELKIAFHQFLLIGY